MPELPFRQVDVFATEGLTGNPVAVVHDARGVTDDRMQAFARWTNLSETTFLLPPTDPAADYRLRIFTPGGELPFAGHPTLGSGHAWLEAGGIPASPGRLVQECGVGLVTLRVEAATGGSATGGLSFTAPPLLRSGPATEQVREQAVAALGIAADRVLAVQWVDNGPGWLGLLLASADDVLALQPDFAAMGDQRLGVIGPHGPGGSAGLGADYEVRAFVPSIGVNEDPVTGSLNAGLAQWLIGTGRAAAGYTVRQGTAMGRAGLVRIDTDEAERVWVGGASRTVVTGHVDVG